MNEEKAKGVGSIYLLTRSEERRMNEEKAKGVASIYLLAFIGWILVTIRIWDATKILYKVSWERVNAKQSAKS